MSTNTPIKDYSFDLNDQEQICGEYENYTLFRFLFVSISSLVALFGATSNLFLFVLFLTRTCANTPPTLYPRVLALLDAMICIGYILLFGADAAIVYLHIKNLFILYYIYIIPAFVISRIVQIAIPYMLIFATLERFVWTARNMENRLLKKMYSVYGRYVTVVVSLLICVTLRLPSAWATQIYNYPKCDDFFRSKSAGIAPWVRDSLIYHIYDFHLLSIAQTVVPFFVLLTFNFITVKRLLKMRVDINNPQTSLTLLNSPTQLSQPLTTSTCSSQRHLSTDSYSLIRKLSSSTRFNPSLRSAIYTMVCIVTSYLVSNTLHLILTILERSDSYLLKHPTDPNLASTFHTTFSDLVSFVYMFTSAIRIAIYYKCNPKIRNDIVECLYNFWKALRIGKKEKIEDNTSTML